MIHAGATGVPPGDPLPTAAAAGRQDPGGTGEARVGALRGVLAAQKARAHRRAVVAPKTFFCHKLGAAPKVRALQVEYVEPKVEASSALENQTNKPDDRLDAERTRR